MIDGNPDVSQIHLVEPHATVDLMDWPDLDAGRRHIDDEHGNATVFRLLGIGPGNHDAAISHVGQRGPHLLAIDDPLVAITHGAHLQACNIRTSAWFGEHLTPDL